MIEKPHIKKMDGGWAVFRSRHTPGYVVLCTAWRPQLRDAWEAFKDYTS